MFSNWTSSPSSTILTRIGGTLITPLTLDDAAALPDKPSTLASTLLKDISEQGFYHGKGLSENRLLDLCRLLGRPRGDVRDPRLVRILKPQPVDSAPSNTLSSRYGTGAFPFHTETAYWYRPTRFLVLHCVSPGSGLRPTLLIDSRSFRFSNRERQILANAAWKVAARKTFLCSVFRTSAEKDCLRFDPECMVPFTNNAALARLVLLEQLEVCPRVSIAWEADDLLVIDNERMLHARGETKVPDLDRALRRVLVEEVLQ